MSWKSDLGELVDQACCEMVDRGYSPETILMNRDTLDLVFERANKFEIYSDSREENPMRFMGLGIEIDNALDQDTFRIRSKVIGASKLMYASRTFDRATINGNSKLPSNKTA